MKTKLNWVFTILFFVCVSISISQNVSFELLQKYHYNSGNLDHPIAFGSLLANSAPIGDLDKDGNNDIAIGLYGEGAESEGGEVLICFLKEDGSIREFVQIAEGKNGFNDVYSNGVHTVKDGARFGWAIENIGDIDGDGIQDIAVGAYEDWSNPVNEKCGSVFILRMNQDGTVKAHQRIGEGIGGFTNWGAQELFGSGLTALGDINGDGIPDLAVGSAGDRELGPNSGAVFIIQLNSDGTVKAQSKITPTGANFSGVTSRGYFGWDVDNIGDIDGDGNDDLLVGVRGTQTWLLFMDENYSVKSTKYFDLNSPKIKEAFPEAIYFGGYVASLPDINFDGRNEMVISTYGSATSLGTFGVFYLDSIGSISSYDVLDPKIEGLNLNQDQHFGGKLSVLGDLNKDGFPEVGVGEPYNCDSIFNGGALYLISLKPRSCIDDECLWPGDCNNDGIVNVKDLIPIGSAFLDSNLNVRRILPTTDWMIQYAGNWQDKKWDVDKKFADCNGDGKVDIQDRDAIQLNYGYTQQKMYADPELDPYGPLLNLVAIKDSVVAGDTVKFDLYFGESTKEAENVYAITMSLEHNIASFFGKTENKAEFLQNWLGTDSVDMITMYQPTEKGIDIAMVRTDKQNRSGHGRIASIDIVTPDNLVEKVNEIIKLNLTDFLIVSYEEDTIIPDFKSDAVGIINPVSVKSIFNKINLFPNPSSGIITVKMDQTINDLKVLDIQGRVILSMQPNKKNFSVNLEGLETGKYFLAARSKKKSYLSHIIKK
ncbi:MAG: hypothetical protein CMP61_03680 [Flavobacteriales bacterium]|nr:hypothetical protein [Flavobacteriales bacterium]|tara:strand:- start:5977 stop:8274 length:2298 start_codon:yes stop_codon:yes gene_type:complete